MAGLLEEKKIGIVKNSLGILGELLIFDLDTFNEDKDYIFYCLETIKFEHFSFSRNIILVADSLAALKRGDFTMPDFFNKNSEQEWQRTGDINHIQQLSKDLT